MPWSLQNRDGKVCVIKDSDGSVAGCHDSRADAIKQQRALYANESRMAAIYDDLDADPEIASVLDMSEDVPVPVMPGVSGSASELVKIEIGKDNEALTASVLAQMERMNERQAATDTALIAALQAIGQREAVVNVTTPETVVNVPEAPAPVVNVDVPETKVEFKPEITVQQPEIHLPSSQKTVTFERDPLTGQVSKAEVTEA